MILVSIDGDDAVFRAWAIAEDFRNARDIMDRARPRFKGEETRCPASQTGHRFPAKPHRPVAAQRPDSSRALRPTRLLLLSLEMSI
jgi:hypothetical protein